MGLRRPIYALLGIFVVIGSVSAAYAIGIQLAGDVTIDGTLTTGGAITSPTITDLQNQIAAIVLAGSPFDPANPDVDFLDGINSAGFAKSSQSCTAGQLVIGFDASGNEICRELRIVHDFTLFFSVGSNGGGQSIALGNDGFPIVSHVGVTLSDLRVIHCTNPHCTFMENNQVVSSAVNSVSTSIVIGNDNLPIIAYIASPGGLRVVHCTDVSCSSSDTPVTVETVQPSIVDMVIGNDGNPIIVYTRAFDSNGLKIAHCPDATCTGSITTTALDPGVSVNDAKAIAIGSDGFPIIAYMDSNNEDLKVIRCTSFDCTSIDPSSPVTLDSGAVNTQSVSIAIGNDNLPIISYPGLTLSALQVIHCTDVACSNPVSPVVIDDGGLGEFGSQNVGEESSIQIGNDGFPIIVYGADTSEQFVRLVKCTSFDCSTFNPPEYIIRVHDFSRPMPFVIGNDGFLMIVYENDVADLKIVKVGGIGFS